jgi:hypothetical protein
MAAHRDPERPKKTRTRSSTAFLRRKQSKSGSTCGHYYGVLESFCEIFRDADKSFAVARQIWFRIEEAHTLAAHAATVGAIPPVNARHGTVITAR